MKINGHTVGNDGIVYDPGSASWGYVGSMDNRVENNHSDERGALVTDKGRVVPIKNPAAGAVKTATRGGGSGPGAAAVVTAGPKSAGSGPGAAVVVTGPLKPKLKRNFTQLLLGTSGWSHDPGWSDTEEWEARYGEPGDWLGGVTLGVVDTIHNADRTLREMVGPGPAIPSQFVEAQPRFHEGWMTYDEGMTWEPIREGGNPATWSTGTGRNPHSRVITGGGF